MTREEAALAAMNGLLANGDAWFWEEDMSVFSQSVAAAAVELADALIAALATPPASAEEEQK